MRVYLTVTRRGVTLIELIVAATLLISGMSLVGQFAVANGRILQQSRHDRLALDELTNQLEYLTHLDRETLNKAIAELAPSVIAKASLPNPRLNGELVHDVDGDRVVLSIDWDRPQPSKSISLVGWTNALPSSPDSAWERDVLQAPPAEFASARPSNE